MADFNESYKILLANEGNYANDPDDSGGETYKGISRNNFPKWDGWAIIDSMKKNSNFPECLNDDFKLQALVGNFYKTEFWNKINGYYIEKQDVATTIFDFAVNSGIITCIKVVQSVISVPADGIMGVITLQKLNTFDSSIFKTQFAIGKIRHYLAICRKRPINMKFLYNWINRSLSTLVIFLLLALNGCVTYTKCIDKFGEYPKDTVFVPVETPVEVITADPAVTAQTHFNPTKLNYDTIYVDPNKDTTIKISYWRDTTNEIFVNALKPERYFVDTLLVRDTIPCPPQPIIVKEDSKMKVFWENYKKYSAFMLPIILILVVFGLFRRK